jgi:predicted kinase
MNNLIILVGLPASGKSTFAKEKLANEETIILSSDKLRKELLGDENCQTNNELVFSTLYARAKEHLLNGKNVVIDATNINIKDRRRTLSHFQGMNIKRIAMVFATPINVCYERDSKRDRVVGIEIIDKFLHRFELPMKYEGFDNIEIIRCNNFYDCAELTALTIGYDQKNPHHKHTLDKHCLSCFLKIKDLTKNENLIRASSWHDIGKVFTQTFDEEGVAHYYSHHNIGAYILMCSNLPVSDENLKEIIFYVNFHMNPFFWKEEKTHDKYRKLFGEELYNNLILLNECDKFSSSN